METDEESVRGGDEELDVATAAADASITEADAATSAILSCLIRIK